LSAPHEGPVEASVYDIIGAALRKAVAPVEGVKRDQLFQSHIPRVTLAARYYQPDIF
jgi:hypothetical protein